MTYEIQFCSCCGKPLDMTVGVAHLLYPKTRMQRVGFEMAYKNFPEGDDIYSLSPHDRGRIEGYNCAIDDIKSKYGDLWVEVK